MGKSYIQTTTEDFKEALEINHGLITQTAEYLGMSRQAVRQRILLNPELQAFVAEIDEQTLDRTVGKLVEAIDNGEPWAVLHYLKTKGKSRGFSESVDINVNAKMLSATVDLGKLSMEELEKLNELIGKTTTPKLDSGESGDL